MFRCLVVTATVSIACLAGNPAQASDGCGSYGGGCGRPPLRCEPRYYRYGHPYSRAFAYPARVNRGPQRVNPGVRPKAPIGIPENGPQNALEGPAPGDEPSPQTQPNDGPPLQQLTQGVNGPPQPPGGTTGSELGDKKFGGQKTCPVLGEELGSMGEPIPVAVKGTTIFVCCKGCVSKVKRDPDKYVKMVEAERAGS